MAIRYWLANASKKKQTVTLTVGSTTVGHTFTTTINGKVQTYIAVTGDTTTTIATAIQALLSSTSDPEFQAIGWTSALAVVTGVAANAGEPFTVSVGGTGTYTLATPQANSSPNDVNVAANWGTVPVSTDSIVIADSAEPLLWNLETAFSAVDIVALTRYATHTAQIGNPIFTTTGYREYRGVVLTMQTCTTLNWYQSPQDQEGAGFFNVGANACTVNCYGDQPGVLGQESLWWIGTEATPLNVVNVNGGGIHIAPRPSDTSNVLTLRVNNGVATCGPGTTLSGCAITQKESTIETNSAVATWTQDGASSTSYHRSGAITTLNVDAGTFYHLSSGNITTLNVGTDATVDFSGVKFPITVTNCYISAGGAILDPDRRVTFTNGINLFRCTLAEVTLVLGNHIRVTIAAYS